MWIILIMLFPVFGTFVYVLMLLSLLFGKTFRNIIKEQKKASSYYIQDESIIDEICNDNPDAHFFIGTVCWATIVLILSTIFCSLYILPGVLVNFHGNMH